MKQHLLTLPAVLLTLLAFSQSPQKLIKENGYMQFKFDSKPSDYTNIKLKDNQGGDVDYYYDGPTIRTFNYGNERIDLIFSENKLYEVGIYFSGGEDFYEKIKKQLELLYGPAGKRIRLPHTLKIGTWETDRVHLLIQLYDNDVITVRFMKMWY